MSDLSRRAFAVGVLAAVSTTTASTAADPPAEDLILDPEPVIEFDGRVHQNPKYYRDGRVAVTGVVRPPAGTTIQRVIIKWQPTSSKVGAPPNNPDGYQVYTAVLDTTKTPTAWRVMFNSLPEDTSVYVIAAVELSVKDSADMLYETLDRRTARWHPIAKKK